MTKLPIALIAESCLNPPSHLRRGVAPHFYYWVLVPDITPSARSPYRFFALSFVYFSFEKGGHVVH